MLKIVSSNQIHSKDIKKDMNGAAKVPIEALPKQSKNSLTFAANKSHNVDHSLALILNRAKSMEW